MGQGELQTSKLNNRLIDRDKPTPFSAKKLRRFIVGLLRMEPDVKWCLIYTVPKKHFHELKQGLTLLIEQHKQRLSKEGVN